MGKRIITLLLAVTFILFCSFCFVPIAYAIGSYGVNLASGAYQTTVNPFYAYRGDASNGAGGECTWYAWGRAYEKLGVSLPCRGNANSWTSEAANAGWSTGTIAKANSIMVEHYSGTGHVMFVEKVENGKAYISEGNWKTNGVGVYHEDAINLSTMQRDDWPGHTLGQIDYIYLDTTYHGSEMTSGAGRTLMNGDYEIVSTGNTNYQLDISGNAVPAANGTNVGVYMRDSTPRVQDIFTVTYLDNGFFKIIQKGTNMTLDVDGASIVEGANVKIMPYVGNTAQQYSISYAPIDDVMKTYRIQPRCSGLALDISGIITNNANVQQWRVNDTQAQGWLFIPYQPTQPVENGRYILLSGMDASYELDISGDSGSVLSGTNVQVWKDTCASRYNSFDFKKQSDGYYKVTHAASGLELGVVDGGSVFGQNIAVLTPSNTPSQRWAVTKYGSGYVLRVKSCGYTIDAASNATLSNGINVHQYPFHGNNNQIWKFVKAEYKVSYQANGGSGTPANQTKYYKANLTISSTKPTRTGYSFVGWNTDKNATSANYQPGASYTKDEDLTLYAIWKANTYMVSFDANGGSCSTGSKNVTYNSTYGNLPKPERIGYQFDGWYTAVSGGTKVTKNTTVTTANNHTLYAHWTLVNPFVDVQEGAYFYESVLWAYYHEPQITAGTDATHFSPKMTCTREQIVTFLYATAGRPGHSMTDNPFRDVSKSKYYSDAVMWAVENGVTGGVGDGKFGVGVGCTREQAVTFLWKALGSAEPAGTECSFTDVKPKQYYYKAVLWAVENGVTGGVGNGKFGVGQTCTRAQIVTFLYAAFEKEK